MARCLRLCAGLTRGTGRHFSTSCHGRFVRGVHVGCGGRNHTYNYHPRFFLEVLAKVGWPCAGYVGNNGLLKALAVIPTSRPSVLAVPPRA